MINPMLASKPMHNPCAEALSIYSETVALFNLPHSRDRYFA